MLWLCYGLSFFFLPGFLPFGRSLMMSVISFCDRILTLATRVRFSVLSWGRTPRHNSLVEGHEHSYHMIWMAVDIELDSASDFPVLDFEARRLNLEVVRSNGGIHIEPAPDRGWGS